MKGGDLGPSSMKPAQPAANQQRKAEGCSTGRGRGRGRGPACQADQLSHGREPSETGRVMVGAAGSASGGPLKSLPVSPGSL